MKKVKCTPLTSTYFCHFNLKESNTLLWKSGEVVLIATSWVKITITNKPVLEHNSQQQLSQKGGIIGIKSSSQLIGCIFGNTGLTKHHRQSSSQPQ